MTLKKRLRPIKKSFELRHMSRKYVWKLLHWDYWPKGSLTRIWRNGDMTHECPAVVQSQNTENSFPKRGMDMQIVSEVVLGINNGGPSCCRSAEHERRWHQMLTSSCSLRQGWRGVCESRKSAIFAMSGFFLHNCITPSSPNCTNMLYRYEYFWQCLTYEYCVLDPHSW